MGIKNLSYNLKRKCSKLYNICKLTKFAGHRIGIDISIFFYAFKNSAIKQTLYTTDLRREELDYQVVTSYWLQKFHEMMMMFIECDIMPIPVFDGPPHRLKKSTKDNRKEKLENTKSAIISLRDQISEGDYDDNTIAELEANLKTALWTTKEEVLLLKKMFDDMGVYYYQSKTEAECELAELCKQGYCSAVYTRDSDAFAYRTPIIITNVEKRRRLGRPHHRCTYVIFDNVLKLFKMNEKQFVDFCILCGTDYNNNLAVLRKGMERNERTQKYKPPSYGYAKSLALIKKYMSVESIIKIIQPKGYIIGYYEGIEYLEKHGPQDPEFFKEMRKEDKFEHRDITYPEILEEIRGYFLNPPELNIDREPVHYVTGNMKTCFDEILTGPNKKRMLQEADKITTDLHEFEIRFVHLQIVTLVINEEI